MTETRPFIRLRGRSIMALVLTPEPPLPGWLAALDAQIERAPNFFDGRPVIVDVGTLPSDMPDVAGLLHAIAARGIHIIGMEGAHPSWPGLELWGRPLPGAGKPGKAIEIPETAAPPPRPAPAAPTPVAPAAPSAGPEAVAAVAPEPASLVINHSIRSGQSIAFEHGDVTIIGSVASGAEIVAGGSIHIYGTLRGRAMAGINGNSSARIYCHRIEAELLAIDGYYQTAEELDVALRNRPAQAWLQGAIMRITPLN
jgi:septum site-determining protein MinC